MLVKNMNNELEVRVFQAKSQKLLGRSSSITNLYFLLDYQISKFMFSLYF